MCEFYVQGTVQAGLIQLRKIKRTANPGNFLTKHAKTWKEVELGMVDVRHIQEATHIDQAIKMVRSISPTPWKLQETKLRAGLFHVSDVPRTDSHGRHCGCLPPMVLS